MTQDTNTPPASSPDHVAYQQQLSGLIRKFWTALTKPNWTKDDLIALGKAAYAKQTLPSLEPAVFERIFPHLQTIGRELMAQLNLQGPAQSVKDSEPQEEPK